jgi:alanine racemase
VKPLIRATVDAAALRHNLARVRATAPGARVMAVIKANAYGHGLVPAARALGLTDGYAVARLEEGLALRAAGLANPVLLLEGVFSPGQLAVAAQQRFDIMVHSFEQLELLEGRGDGGPLSAWLKVDTGMNRLGFRVEQFAAAWERLRRMPNVTPDPTLVTHLACADEVEDPRTSSQLRTFEEITAGRGGARSIANSAGLFAWPASRADWVRPGIALYGVSPFPAGTGRELGLRPAMTLRTQVIAVRVVRPGETVGYGGTWRASRPTRIAVVAAGYGDGYPRGVGSGTPVLVGGHRAHVVGRVSMDMLTVDVTSLPGVAPGDEVVLWGDGLPVEEISRHAGTIPYELVCGVSQRVHHEVC